MKARSVVADVFIVIRNFIGADVRFVTKTMSGPRNNVVSKVILIVASVAASESVPAANSEAMTDSAFSERMPEATLKERLIFDFGE